MARDYPNIPHIALPFRLNVNGEVTVNEQDDLDDVYDCVQAIYRYPLGYRLERPDFGLPDFAMRMGVIDVSIIRSAVERWEERAALSVNQNIDDLDSLIQRVISRVSTRRVTT